MCLSLLQEKPVEIQKQGKFTDIKQKNRDIFIVPRCQIFRIDLLE